MSDHDLPAPRPRVSPFVLPLGGRRRNAYGKIPMDPGLLPMNLLRAHLYPGNEAAIAEGIEELRQNINRGAAIPQLPQRMAWQHNKLDPSSPDGRRDPRASAISVARAIAETGRLTSVSHEITVSPRDATDAAMRAQVQQQLFARHVTPGDTVPTDPARQTAQTTMPTDGQLLSAYGAAQGMVVQNAVDRRQTFVGRAMAEVNAQTRKVLGMLRSQEVDAVDERYGR